MLYPFALWSAVHGVVFRMPANLDSALQLGTGGTYLFFLAFLFGFNALSYPLRGVHPGITAGAALGVGAVAPSQFPSVPDRFTERFWYLLAMFMLGRCASSSPDTWRRLQQSRAMLLAASTATLAGSLAATRGRQPYRWQWAWSPALAMVLFARAARAIEDSGASRPLCFVGQNSIVYYTMHFPVAYGVIRWSQSRGVRSGWRALATTLVAQWVCLQSRRWPGAAAVSSSTSSRREPHPDANPVDRGGPRSAPIMIT